MKKKFLSLLMAGVMVASVAVPAHATKTVIGNEGEDKVNAEIKVTGTVVDESGALPAGRIQVEVPTALSFMVKKDGSIQSQQFQIKNLGDAAVEVRAKAFTDNPGNIDIVKNTDITGGSGATEVARNKVALSLKAQDGTNTSVELATPESFDSALLATVQPNNSGYIALEGIAGQKSQSVTTAMEEQFNLILEIKKNG